MAMQILDNHVHLEPVRGRHVDSVRDFERKGGTHIIISSLPFEEIPTRSPEDFRRSYDATVHVKDRACRETGVKAYVTVGPYPVELIHLAEAHGLVRAEEIMLRAMDIAGEFVQEGRALALGEVGRPHFPVSAEIWESSNRILMHGMRLAKELDCAIVLHTESATTSSMRELAEMAESVGLRRSRVVKHYAPPLVLEEENFGLMPSVLASREAIDEALRKGSRFLMETDFLDDPRRPGAVLSITTVPKRTMSLIDKGVMTKEQAYVIHSENPRIAYGDRFS